MIRHLTQPEIWVSSIEGPIRHDVINLCIDEVLMITERSVKDKGQAERTPEEFKAYTFPNDFEDPLEEFRVTANGKILTALLLLTCVQMLNDLI